MIDSAGYVYAAGCSELGQLGMVFYNFNPQTCDVPFVIVPPFSRGCPAVKVCAGDGFSLALDYDGDVFSCGKGNFGRLGQGHTSSLNTMTRIDWFTKAKIQIKDICAGGRHCLAISEEDAEENGRQALYGWGFGYYHQLG